MLFFYFFKILIFWVVRRVKGQKMAKNDKKLCPLHVLSQKPYIIWSLFMVQMCKRIISPGVFYLFFEVLIFWVNNGVKRIKWPKMTKTCVCGTPYLSKHVFCCTSLKWWHLQTLFSFFSKFCFSWLLGGGESKRAKDGPKWQKKVHQ